MALFEKRLLLYEFRNLFYFQKAAILKKIKIKIKKYNISLFTIKTNAYPKR